MVFSINKPGNSSADTHFSKHSEQSLEPGQNIYESVLVLKNGKLTIWKLKSSYFVIQPPRKFAHHDLVLNIVFGEYWKKDLGVVWVQQTD